jgi:hypothetical protein
VEEMISLQKKNYMRSLLLRRGKFVQLTLGEAPSLRILIILMDIQREKSKRLLRRNLLCDIMVLKSKMLLRINHF